MIQSVFVHATVDRGGKVIEAETLQSSNPELSEKAIEALKSSNQGNSGMQREVYVNVELPNVEPANRGQAVRTVAAQ